VKSMRAVEPRGHLADTLDRLRGWLIDHAAPDMRSTVEAPSRPTSTDFTGVDVPHGGSTDGRSMP
jgi:hypothetical protein